MRSVDDRCIHVAAEPGPVPSPLPVDEGVRDRYRFATLRSRDRPPSPAGIVRLARRLAILLALSAALVRALWAQGGPPLLTDDPGTPGPGRWEVNLAATVEHRGAARMLEMPLADVNYGVGERAQLKAEIPWLVSSLRGAGTRTGWGAAVVGVKWRFLDDSARKLAVSTYPQLEFGISSASVDRGLIEAGRRVLLPLEAARRVGRVSVNVEVGYELAQRGSDERLYGVALGAELTPTVQLLAELHDIVSAADEGHDAVLDVGTRITVARYGTLLLSVGHLLRSNDLPRGTRAYLGWQRVW
jgi:hypothetical protein